MLEDLIKFRIRYNDFISKISQKEQLTLLFKMNTTKLSNKNNNQPRKMRQIVPKNQLNLNFFEKYDFNTQNQTWNINSFEQVGWLDPFPFETKKDEECPCFPRFVSEMAYESDRFIPKLAPFVIYIPKKEIMWKIMRACIGVTTKEGLWCSKFMH